MKPVLVDRGLFNLPHWALVIIALVLLFVVYLMTNIKPVKSQGENNNILGTFKIVADIKQELII